MKNIAILSILFASLLTSEIKNNSDYVRIEYVGDASVETPSIFISENRIPDEQDRTTIASDPWAFPYLVYNNELVFIEKAINAALIKPFEEKDSNGFKITTRKNNATIAYFITRKDSNSLFLKINTYLETHNGSKDLILAITDHRLPNVLPANAVKSDDDYVRVEYVGETNVTTETIFISENRIPDQQDVSTVKYNSWPNPYFVYSNELIFIENATNTALTKPFEEKDYNGFKITKRENNSTICYFITRKDSNSLFLKINAYLETHKGNKNLILAINSISVTNVFPK